MTLESARLHLVPWNPADLLALIETPERFAEQFGYPAAAELTRLLTSDAVSQEWLAMLRRHAASGAPPDPWTFGFALVHRERHEVIGSASFKGPPDNDAGSVEIAYGVVPSVEGQGYATEAATTLLSFALGDPRVRTVLAHTLPREGPSPGVLRKCGFIWVGEVLDPEDGPVWRWVYSGTPG